MVICFVLIFHVMHKLNFFREFTGITQSKALVIISIIYCLGLYALLIMLEGLSIGKRRILDLCFGFFFSTVSINAGFAVVSGLFFPFHLGKLVLIALLLVVIESSLGIIWIMSCHRVYERYQFCKEAIFIYGSREDEGEFTRINNTINQYFKISRSIDCKVGLEKICEEIQESSVVYLGDIPVSTRNRILKYCMQKKIDCYCIPKISDIYIQNAKVFQLNDKLLLRYPPLEVERGKAVIKRGMDIIVSSLMLVCASPVMLVIAAAVKLTDGGPVFYRQQRVTKDGEEFIMYKFRSMRVDAEKSGARLAAKDDERITRVGRIIRNIHFDELPQLVNILKGEMSLVGPRPERKEFIEEYSRFIPEFPERLKVKGGLTGYAQIYGRYNTEPEDKIKYDLYYIYNYSLRMDIKILILTVRILFQKENTEGVDEGQISALKERPAAQNAQINDGLNINICENFTKPIGENDENSEESLVKEV